MKSSVGKFGLIAATLVSPLLAQNIASQPGTAIRDVGRLTLLYGPEMLSWPPQASAPKPQNQSSYFPAFPTVGAAPAFRFIPGNGTLTLGPSKRPVFSDDNPDLPKPAPATRPAPEALRFDTTLPATPLKPGATPKRD